MATSKLTPKEIDLLVAVVTSANIQVGDWNVIAKAANMNTSKYARDTWNGIKKKLKQDTNGDGDDGSDDDNNEAEDDATPVKKKAPAKKPTTTRRRKAKDPLPGSEDEVERPLKKAKGVAAPIARTPRKKAVEADKDDDYEEEEVKGEREESLQNGGSIFGGGAEVKAEDEV